MKDSKKVTKKSPAVKVEEKFITVTFTYEKAV